MTTPGPRFLVIGGDGYLGSALFQALLRQGFDTVATTRRPDAAAPRRLCFDLQKDSPALLPVDGIDTAFLMAGNASVMACEADPEGTAALNVEALWRLADHLSSAGIRLVYPSTSRVFDGSRPNMPPLAPTCPITEYGRQRAAVEAKLLNRPGTAVLRITKVIDRAWPLLADWRAGLSQNQSIHPFSNATAAPVTLKAAVEGLMSVALSHENGIFQLSAADDIAMPEAAMLLAKVMGKPHDLIRPIPGTGFPGLFPPFSSLDGERMLSLDESQQPTARQVIEDLIAP